MIQPKNFFVLVLLLISVNAFCQDNTFQLNGKIDAQYNGNQIMLFTFQQDTIHTVDTTVIENGEFHFQGKEYLADFSIVTTGNYPDKVISSEVILNKGTIHLELDSISRVWGGELNDKLLLYEDSLRVFSGQRMSCYKDSSQGASHKRKIVEGHLQIYVYDFMIKNQANLLGMRTFMKHIGAFAFDSTKFEELCDIFDKERKNPQVKIYLNLKVKYAQRFQSIGKKYEDFEFETSEGISKKLSDYVGKSEYIFIDFWASWCGPCIADMPHLKETYGKYKDKGFEIIGISLDTNKKSWFKALDKINAPWDHLCNFEGFRSKLAEVYYLKGIPYGILLDKEGVIIETNLRSSMLDKKLQELFHTNPN